MALTTFGFTPYVMGNPRPDPLDSDFIVPAVCPTIFEPTRGAVKVLYHGGEEGWLGYPSYTFGWKKLTPSVAHTIRQAYKSAIAPNAQNHQRFWFYALNIERMEWFLTAGIMEKPTQAGFDGSNFLDFQLMFTRVGLDLEYDALRFANRDKEIYNSGTYVYGASKYAHNEWRNF